MANMLDDPKNAHIGAWYATNGEKEVTIEWIAKDEEVVAPGGKKSKMYVAHCSEKRDCGLPVLFPLNQTNKKMLLNLFGSIDSEYYKGKNHKIILYTENDVKSPSGGKTSGLRIRPYVPKAAELLCEECGGEIKAANSKSPKWIAQYTKENYGKQLCSECAKKMREAQSNETDTE